jgi:hypothetical protein
MARGAIRYIFSHNERKNMKHIFAGLILLPLSTLAMNEPLKKNESANEKVVVISLTRDGEGGRQLDLFSDETKEVKKSFDKFSRDLKSKYQYNVAFSLLKLEKGKATIKGSIGKKQAWKEKNNDMSFLTETIIIEEQTIPVNERKVMEFNYLSDLENPMPVVLGLVILDLPKPKL